MVVIHRTPTRSPCVPIPSISDSIAQITLGDGRLSATRWYLIDELTSSGGRWGRSRFMRHRVVVALAPMATYDLAYKLAAATAAVLSLAGLVLRR